MAEDINSCSHFDKQNHRCKDNVEGCGMFNNYYLSPTSKYVRKPRWYEKYYKTDNSIS